MQNKNLPRFIPDPNTTYKVISVMNTKQVFTINPNTRKLVIYQDQGSQSQVFKVMFVNNKYLFVNPVSGEALRVDKQSKGDGNFVKAELGHFQSNFFELIPVAKGQYAGHSFHIATFSHGKVLDIRGGQPSQNNDICQWTFDGQASQQWLIIPSKQTYSQKPQSHHGQLPDVPYSFEPQSSTSYKIFPLLDRKKSITVGYDNKLHINTYKNTKEQKFSIHWDKGKNKYAFIASNNNSRFYLNKDSHDNQVDIITVPGNHVSNWFDIARVQHGRWAGKAYLIITHAKDKCLDIRNGKFEQNQIIHQYTIKQSQTQLWLIQAVYE